MQRSRDAEPERQTETERAAGPPPARTRARRKSQSRRPDDAVSVPPAAPARVTDARGTLRPTGMEQDPLE